MFQLASGSHVSCRHVNFWLVISAAIELSTVQAHIDIKDNHQGMTGMLHDWVRRPVE